MPLSPDAGLFQLIVTPVSLAEPEQHPDQLGLMNAVPVSSRNAESVDVAV